MASFRYKHGDRPLEGYTIQRGAGRGGFGEVYYAVSDSGREVALKVVNDYAQIELRGISQCMNLKSPHLVTIFDVKYNDEGVPFVIMEYVSGPTLRQLLDESPGGLGPQKAAFFLREIGKGLSFLHDCGIVHRDLKPGNIFYENGYVKIGDYGLSKAITASQHSGQTITVGTVHYMAPEIGMGKYDRGIDIYAMGAMLYELLTGQVPYLGSSPAEIIMKHVTGEPNVQNIEEPFATVIKKAMAKDPAQRYQSVQEMIEAVFGAQHVQQSVSQFSPDDLTMVAQRVARRVAVGVGGGGGTGGSSATPPPLPPRRPQSGGEFADRMGQWGHRVGELGERFGEWASDMGNRFGGRMAGLGVPANSDAAPEAPPAPPALNDEAGNPQRDPLTRRQRLFLTVLTAVFVSGATGVFADSHSMHNAAIPVFLVVFLIALGSAGGMLLARWRFLPHMHCESSAMRRLVMGSTASVVIGILAAIISSAPSGQQAGMPESCLAAILLMFLLDWTRWTSPARPDRIAFNNVVKAGALGLVLSMVFDGNMLFGLGLMAGIALVVQVLAPWDPLARNRSAAWRPQQPGAVPLAAHAAAAMASPRPTPRAAAIARRPTPNRPGTPVPVIVNPGRPVIPIFRWIWLICGLLLVSNGILLLASMGFVRYHRNEEPLAIGFGVGMVLLGLLCGVRSSQARFQGWWTYLFRPLLMWACVQSILISALFLGWGPTHDSDAMAALFFLIFPATLLLAVLFVRFRHPQLPPPLPVMMGVSPDAPTMLPAASADPAPPAAPAVPAGDAPADAAGPIPAPAPEAFAPGDGTLPEAWQPFSLLDGTFALIGSLLLIAALAIGVASAFNVPPMIASGALDPKLAEDLNRDLGFNTWPQLAQKLISLAAYLGLFLAGACLMISRRSLGAAHIIRVPLAVAAFSGGLWLLSESLRWGTWRPVHDVSGRLLPAAAIDAYLNGIQTAPAVLAAVLATVAVVLFLWPAASQRRLTGQGQ